MNLLLDTHIFLWFITDDPKLPTAAANAIQDPANKVILSAVSVWEAAIKFQTGKLPLPAPPDIYLPYQRHLHDIESLALDEGAVRFLPTLPEIHRDPFDRILICQALQHGLTLVTVDSDILQYPVPTLR